MKNSMKQVVLCAVALSMLAAATPAEDASSSKWPSSKMSPEDALADADGVFYGILHITDIVIESSAYLTAMGRIDVSHLVFGDMADDTIDFGRQGFVLWGSQFDISEPWWRLGPGIRDGIRKYPVLVAFEKAEGRVNFLWIEVDDGSGLPSAKDILQVRQLIQRQEDEELSQVLQYIAAKDEASDFLWRYALRRLGRFETDLIERFRLVFSDKLQATGNRGRLEYAKELLLTNNCSVALRIDGPGGDGGGGKARLKWLRGGPTDGKLLRMQFLAAAEGAPNAVAAEIALLAVGEHAIAADVVWTEAERAMILSRASAICADSKTPIGRLPENQCDSMVSTLQEAMEDRANGGN